MDRFSGRVAVVTGASSGIGAEVAKDLAKAGLVVVAVARRKERLQALASSLQGSAKGLAKGKLHPLQADLSKPGEVRRVFQWVDDNLGGVAVLVNNAAVLPMGPFPDADAPEAISTNLMAMTVASQEAIKSMQKHDIKDGHIININSLLGHSHLNPPAPVSVTVYIATKHGVTALSKGLRFDIQRIPGFKTRVTSVSPGAVLTEMLPKEHVNGREVLQTGDISNAVLYALSCPPSVEITELTVLSVREAY